MTGQGPGLGTACLSVSDEKWSQPHHPASLTPLRVPTVSSGMCASRVPAAVAHGPRGQVSSCSGAPRVHLFTFSLSSAFSTFPVFITHSPLPAHPSLVHPTCDLSPTTGGEVGLPPSYLPSSVSSQSSQSEFLLHVDSLGS